MIRRPNVVLTAPSFVDASLPSFRSKKGEQSRSLEPAEGFSEPKQRKSLILVVEDNPDMREYICETLGPDVAIETAENGREGLEKAHTMMPDLIISDIMMPEMDGDEMFRKLRGNRETETIPFILVTAKADEELRIELLREGAIEYLIKPFMPEELKAKARNFLEVKASEVKYRQLMESAQVDVGTVVKASQAVSGEIELGKLIKTLLRIAVEHAGAERGLLILFRSNKLWLEAEATTGSGGVEFTVRKAEVTPADLPESLLHHVIQTRESVILDDAVAPTLFSADAYVQHRQPRSVLCLPLVKQAKLVGALYLENNLTPRVFTSNRIAVLEVLASQAAISLENATLYAELINENRDRQKAEAALLRSEASLSEAQQISHTGSWRWKVGTGEVSWSAEHFRIFAFDPATTQPCYATFMERIHAEDRSSLEQALDRAVRERSRFQHEYRIALPTGSVKHLQSVGLPDITESGDLEFVGTVMDITERRRADEALRSAQAELARVARLTTMGELTASIAHEVNQPLSGVVSNAEACLRWLDREIPDLEAVRRSVEWVVDDGNRAGEVIRRVRALAKKTDIEKVPLDVNDVIREVMALVRRELINHRVSLRMDLALALPMILADRVQLQQVIINLVMNGIEAMQSVTDRPRELVIRSDQDETQQVLVSVTDCGVGISAENADRLFNAFFTTKASGMGMGLSICRSIMEALGGRLWATANIPHGATFHLTLPLNADTAS